MAQRIPLTKGLYAVVDDDDYEHLSQWKWHVITSGLRRYAARTDHSTGKKRMILMHRVITAAPAGMDVDHRNHDTLDNQRENLRVATRSLNSINQRIKTNNTTGYKGVSLDRRRGTYNAYITKDRARRFLGGYESAEEAAAAYDNAALELFGEFACTNASMGLLS